MTSSDVLPENDGSEVYLKRRRILGWQLGSEG
jgi:hypothetical protein